MKTPYHLRNPLSIFTSYMQKIQNFVFVRTAVLDLLTELHAWLILQKQDMLIVSHISHTVTVTNKKTPTSLTMWWKKWIMYWTYHVSAV